MAPVAVSAQEASPATPAQSTTERIGDETNPPATGHPAETAEESEFAPAGERDARLPHDLLARASRRSADGQFHDVPPP